MRVQPIHALRGGALLGAEVLGGGPTPWMPDPTSPCGTGWIGPASLMHLACLEAGLWGALTSLSSPILVAVRVPVPFAPGSGLLADIEYALDRTGLPAHLLEIGLDARHLPDEGAMTLLGLHALRDLGVGIALTCVRDTPGLPRRLRHLPLTCLRLHADEVAPLERGHDARRALAAIASAAHDHGMIVVATGVRASVQRDILADLGCDAGQGRLFGSAMDAALFRAALSRPRVAWR